MNALWKHVWRSIVAGIVALLPIGGTVLVVMYLESLLRDAWNGIEPLEPYYFPGLGLIAATVLIYGVGLLVSTFLGRGVLSLLDRIFDRLPLLGSLYQTLKQILGYGGGKDAVFQRVVLVPARDHDGFELGLVTATLRDEHGAGKLVVFVPAAPTPTSGRLLVVEPASVKDLDISVHDALSTLVTVGKSDVPILSGSTS